MTGVLLWLYFLFLGSVQTGKLLVIPADGSHWNNIKSLVEELGRRGNEVVVVIPKESLSLGPSKHTTTLTYPVNYTVAQIKKQIASNLSNYIGVDTSTDLARFQKYVLMIDALKVGSVKNVESLLFNKDLMKTLIEWEFDAVLTDPFECVGVIVGEYLSIPSIYMQGNHPCDAHFLATKSLSPPSYAPHLATHFTDRMNFWQRGVNTLRYFLQPMACGRLYTHADRIASAFLQKETSMLEIMSHAAIWLEYIDYATEFPRPLMPNVIMMGPIAPETKPLPQDLETFVNGSGEHGFVIFTLGSMVSELPEVKAGQFLEAFRHIPQKVVWRYTGALPKDVPKNVKLMNWLPQNDLLDNVQRVVSRGVAETVNIFDLTSEKLLVALRKVINDKSYKEKMMKLSVIHRDHPIKPLDLAVYWTEYVMRHKGAAHLRSAANELNWIQYHSLDVIGFLLLVLVTVVCVTVKTCMFCFKKCFRVTPKKKKE
ncbi:UDP-glucuronosyltransferase 1-6-like isoform X2 [Electrophorus electricus]|uniref:UDP-glucuronosyltransferase 1-6-like isoform X2 n=1 Tax=Electrophorus electricus TaxID=8005 RepID=UPI0015D0211A|nr:UDP-glucuronosyltransferase 1-6-like isoform X2 [Electrophorus electricus]